MKEYIEREWLVNEALAVLDFRKKHYTDKARIADAESTVEWLKYYAPAADVVEVVRCKGCRRRYDADECPMCVLIDGEYYEYTNGNGFCDRGERRVDHEN